MPEKCFTEDQIRIMSENAAGVGASDHMQRVLATLLAQMIETRTGGGNPLCVIGDDGEAFVFDNTEMMGT